MKDEANMESFEKILEENKGRIYRICRIYAVSPVEPADLFQEVVYHIWKSIDSYQGDAQISTWIYRVSINVCVRYKLKLDKHNHKTTRLSSIDIHPQNDILDPDKDERYIALRNCIQTLKEGDRSILVLHLEGCPYREISSIIGLSENYIAVKMKRIRKILFKCITPKLTQHVR